MKPRLVFINGSLKDTVLPLSEGAISLGRAGTNAVALNDATVSRRHCQIAYAEGRYELTDLDSTSGTFVNGERVRAHTLAHGDLIGVGSVRCVFLLHDDDPRRFALPVQLHDRAVVSGLTVRLRPEDAVYLRSERMLSSMPPLAQMARDLAALLKLCTTLNALRDAEALQRHLLETVCEVVPAERGAILLTGATVAEIASVYGWERAPDPRRPVPVSRTIAQQVLESGFALLSNDVAERAEFANVKSLEATHIRALLCVPLTLGGRVLGAIYLTTSDAARPFKEDHLHLLTVVSNIAAVALENARHMERLAGENEQLRAESRVEHDLVGASARLRAVMQFVARVAPTDSTVLVRGESGTGKELAARALHRNSARAGGPFVALNCAALTESLLESELFGHERGAFTGAVAQKKGKLELADGGTIFLDEVGELALPLQAKLLRVLQEREFERVGGTRTLKVDVRVVAATNRDLQRAINEGAFRADLYYRLNVVSFEMPPLRERREDIAPLAAYFARKYAQKFRRKVEGVAPEAVAALRAYDWPGNVRELENAIERAVVLGSTETVLPEDLPETVLEAAPAAPAGAAGAPTYHEAVKEAKRQLILRAVERAGGSYTEAARLLGVHPNYLHRLIRNLNLKPALKK
ncbi:MAG TPA: sigma 54-interacting transcriptional regulator [Pyrinomonadaceae bacterium]|jgi:Nif-specific regulatory protein